MQGLREFGTAVLIALLSLGLVIGGFSLALSENFTRPQPTPSQYLPTAPIFMTATHTSSAQLQPTDFPTVTNTPPLAPACSPPTAWVAVYVLPGDTLNSIAARYYTTPSQLILANCLMSETLVPGSTLFVPPLIVDNTPVPCGPPSGWVRYSVQPGDTLYRIAGMYVTTVARLQLANCLGSSDTIRVGQLLWVPNVPPRLLTQTPGVTVIPDFSTSTPGSTSTYLPTEPLTETPPPPTSTPEPPTSTTAPTEPPTATLTAFP
jgi:LysM repeat protein